MVKGTVCLFPFLIFQNERNCCVLILYPATLLNSLMISTTFLIASSWFSIYNTMSSANSDTSHIFQFGFLLFLFFLWLSVARTSKTMFNKSGETELLVLFLILEEMLFSISPLNIVLPVGLTYMSFIMLRYLPSMSTFWRVFVRNRCIIFWKLFVHLLHDPMVFILQLVSVTLIWEYLKFLTSLKSTWSQCMILLMWCWIWFASILLRIFESVDEW